MSLWSWVSIKVVKVILWPWSKVTQISKLKLVFLKNIWVIWNQNSYESLKENRSKIYTTELGHMINMAAMPIYGKNRKKSAFPEPIDPWPWNLVCSIMYVSTTKVVQIKSLVWPWPILRQGQFGHTGFWMGNKWKLFVFWKLLQP